MSKKSSSGRNSGRIKIIGKMKYLLMVLKREAVTNPRKVNMNDVRTTPINSSRGWKEAPFTAMVIIKLVTTARVVRDMTFEKR